jgi:hypothetical protein
MNKFFKKVNRLSNDIDKSIDELITLCNEYIAECDTAAAANDEKAAEKLTKGIVFPVYCKSPLERLKAARDIAALTAAAYIEKSTKTDDKEDVS